MRVLHIINNLGSGGAESMLLNFIKVLNQAKINESDIFEILLLTDNKISYTIPKNIKIHKLSQSNKRFSIAKLFALCSFLKNKKYDIIHTHLFPTQYYMAVCKMISPENYIIITTEHNTTNNRRKHFLTRLLDRLIYKQYNSIVFISNGVKKQFIKDYPIFTNKGIIIHNGIPLNEFSYVSKKLDNSLTKLIMVASFSAQKDHFTLLNALKELDNNIQLSLVGEGNKINEIRNYVKKLNIENQVHFLGFRNDIAKLYNEHDIFVLSSNWEGFGLVAIEAMASGLPVIASAVPGLKEVVNGAGLLFNPRDEKELAQRINSIINNDSLKNQLIIKGLKRAEQYNITHLTHKTYQLYKTLLND